MLSFEIVAKALTPWLQILKNMNNNELLVTYMGFCVGQSNPGMDPSEIAYQTDCRRSYMFWEGCFYNAITTAYDLEVAILAVQ